MRNNNFQSKSNTYLRHLAIGLVLCLSCTTAFAGSRDQARRLFTSLTGTSPNSVYLDEITVLVDQKKYQEAAQKIIKDNKQFYSVTLKTMFTPWSNRDKSTLADLNDMTATMIGVVRDNLPFRSIFTEDFVYFASGTPTGAALDQVLLKDGTTVLRKYFNRDNQHFVEMEAKGLDLSDPDVLVRHSQVPDLHVSKEPVSGILSTRAFGEAFLQAGTNRRPIAFMMENFMCKSMEQLNDTTRPDLRVRRDVDRNPGGDSKVYKSLCVGCHSGMDAMAGAFAYYDFTVGRVTHVIGEPTADSKMNRNVNFPAGFVTTSDKWVLLWNEGPNASLGWPAVTSGNGPRDLGLMFGQTDAFYQCMATKVFTQVCARAPKEETEMKFTKDAARAFKDSNTNMKSLFVDTSIACMGE